MGGRAASKLNSAMSCLGVTNEMCYRKVKKTLEEGDAAVQVEGQSLDPMIIEDS